MKAQILYISHGGGPMPILGDRYHLRMVDFLKGLSTKLKRPDAIVPCSAPIWVVSRATVVLVHKKPKLLSWLGYNWLAPSEPINLRYP